MDVLYGGIEGGGTKFVCAVGHGHDRIVERTRIDTTTPDETLAGVVAFFRRPRPQGSLAAVGVGSFGPVDLDVESPTYGTITTTPKPGWSGADIVGTLRRALGIAVGFDTDVNAAALAEQRFGAGQGADPLVYITVGTGIGGGAIVHGRPLHGLLHPEMGHAPVPAVSGDTFAGVCPYHGRDCLEGVASGPALRARVGVPAEQLPEEHPVWDLTAQYLAAGLLTIATVLSPRRIVLGGGVGGAPGLLPRVHAHLARKNAGYLASPSLGTDVARYVVPPALGTDAGVAGALELARMAHTG